MFNLDLSYHSNEIMLYKYMYNFRNTMSGSQTWHSCRKYGKIANLLKFQGDKIQQKQSCSKCYCKLCPHDLTKWHSGSLLKISQTLAQPAASSGILTVFFQSENILCKMMKLMACHLSSDRVWKKITFDFQKHCLEYQLVLAIILLSIKNSPI